MHALSLVRAAVFIGTIIKPQQQILELVSELSLKSMRASVPPIDAAVLLSTGGSHLSGAPNHVDQLNQMSQRLAVGLPCGRP